MLHDGVGLFQHCAHPRQRLHQRRHLRLSRLLMGGGRAPFRPRCNHRGPPNAIAVGTAPSAIPAFVAMPRHDLTRCVPIPQTSVPYQIASVPRRPRCNHHRPPKWPHFKLPSQLDNPPLTLPHCPIRDPSIRGHATVLGSDL